MFILIAQRPEVGSIDRYIHFAQGMPVWSKAVFHNKWIEWTTIKIHYKLCKNVAISRVIATCQPPKEESQSGTVCLGTLFRTS
jgi:hypothetical protein